MSTELAAGHVSLYAETSHLARDAAQAIDRIGRDMQQTLGRSFDQAGDDLRRSLGRATDEAGRDMQRSFGQSGGQAGQQGGQAAASGMLDGLKGLKGGAVGQLIGPLFALAGVSAGGLFVKALQQGMEREKVLDLTQARLGVDDATMQKIGFAAGRAYGANFGTGVEDNIDTARRAINTGLLDSSGTAQETQEIIQQLSSISDLMGEEIPAVARAAGQAVKTGLVGTATEAFDLFTAAERNGLNASEDFLDTITEYGIQFKKLGLSGPEAVGLINQAVLGGARDTDIAADAVKEFAVRVVDGSDATAEAFQALGFNADDLTARFSAGGSTARTAVGELLGEISKIEDPIEKNQIALALFGTQFEDLGDAFNQFNLDDAAASLGQVAGAAQDAIGTMGGNSASSIESAKRSIEISTDAISSALAKAFGPELAKLADWVSTHQPEILGFLGGVVDFAFRGADAFLAFSSGSLRALANFADGAGPLLSSVLDPVGALAEVFGKLTGNDDLQSMGSSIQDLDSKFHGAAEGARALADGIDNSLRPHLDGMRQSVSDNIESTRLAQEVFRALGQEVIALPDGHEIILRDNTPEVTQRLEALGLKVTTGADGQVRITANTAEAQHIYDAFFAQLTGREVPVTARVTFLDSNGNTTSDPAKQTVHVPGGRYATGGLFRGQGGPTSDSNLIRISDQEHLAYITRAQAASPATIPFLDAINAGWVPPAELLHGMVPGFAAGGVVPGKAFAQSMDPAKYLLGGFSSSAIDCSGMVSATINDALGLPPFSSRMATASEGGWLAAKGAQPGLGGPGTIGVGWVNGGPAGGHTALTLSDGTNVESNGSDGVVIGGPVGANDPMFTNKMHIPAALLRGGDLGGAAGGASAGAGAGGAGGAAGGAGGLGGAAGVDGGTFGGVAVPAGVTPVWIVGGALGAASGTGTGTTSAAPSESFAPQASTPSNVQTLEQVDIGGRALKAGENFLNANVDGLLGDLHLRRSGGAIQSLVSAIWDAMASAAAAEVKKANQHQATSIAQFAGRR